MIFNQIFKIPDNIGKGGILQSSVFEKNKLDFDIKDDLKNMNI